MEVDGQKVLHADADGSASLYASRFEQPAVVPKVLIWRWKTNAPVPVADNRDKKREDSPLRVIVTFTGDAKTLPECVRLRQTASYVR